MQKTLITTAVLFITVPTATIVLFELQDNHNINSKILIP